MSDYDDCPSCAAEASACPDCGTCEICDVELHTDVCPRMKAIEDCAIAEAAFERALEPS